MTLFMEDQVILHWTQWPFAARCSQSVRVQVDISKGVPEIAVPQAAPAGSTSPISLYIIPQGATATLPWLNREIPKESISLTFLHPFPC